MISEAGAFAGARVGRRVNWQKSTCPKR